MLTSFTTVVSCWRLPPAKPALDWHARWRGTGIADHFAASRCADEGFPKPHPDMLLALMDRLGVAPAKTLMIGDTTHDLELARNAGVRALAGRLWRHPPKGLMAMRPADDGAFVTDCAHGCRERLICASADWRSGTVWRFQVPGRAEPCPAFVCAGTPGFAYINSVSTGNGAGWNAGDFFDESSYT